MDEFLIFIPVLLVALVFAVGAICAFRVLKRGIVETRRQIAEEDCRSTRWALIAASFTAICIFVTTYWSAWVGSRTFVALGRDEPFHICADAYHLRGAVELYAKEHGRYPDTLEDASSKDADLTQYVDPWKRPYRYVKTDHGFRLFSLGRDGKPGGVGLDADFDLPDTPDFKIPITFSQFLFEGGGSSTLFGTALTASLFAALACFLAANSARRKDAISWPRFLLSLLVTLVAAFIVVFSLMAIYLVGSSH